MSSIKDLLYELKQSNKDLIPLYDKVFNHKLKFSKFIIDIPAIFEEFIKGITYFNNELETPPPRPIYHRLYSCSFREDTMYSYYHNCVITEHTPEERRKVEERIYKCYIERLIFDNIYLHNTLHLGDSVHSQDTGHAKRLEETEKDFKSCFPKITIDIRLEYIREFPCVLTIIKKVDGKIRFTECYTKQVNLKETSIVNVYDDKVKCILTKSSGVYLRFNTFNLKGRLMRVK